MGQTIQQRQIATMERARAANTVRFNVVLNREQANAILGRYSEDDEVMQAALDAIRKALHAS